MSNTIQIGTRGSALALWQANLVAAKLKSLGFESEIIKIKAIGDQITNKPLHEIGITGLFTKTLDDALLNRQIDLAVHSMKDMPTQIPKNIVQAAVLKRGNVHDVLVYNQPNFEIEEAVIATGSIRRKAQWLHKYPTHKVVDLRGNVPSRLKKLTCNPWQGAIFAQAGLERLKMLPQNHIVLNWMVPAPAQGAIAITALKGNSYILDICSKTNDFNTEIAVHVERQFMQVLEGGCTAPIGGLATIVGDQLHFNGVLCSNSGSHKIETQKATALKNFKTFGTLCAKKILSKGGKQIMEENI